MAGLLVSVRSVAEAQAALAGGAGLIDVKEPSRGPLGRAAAQVVAAVVEYIAGVRPVSAALGELLEEPEPVAVQGLCYVKWGLAECAARADWREQVRFAAERVTQAAPGCGFVAVAYADHRRAGSPSPHAVVEFAQAAHLNAVLIDTFGKDGTTLLDWLSVAEVGRFGSTCRKAGIRLVLAGSLAPAEIELLLPTEPDWFAVRGAACQGDNRTGTVDPVKVRGLTDLVSRRGS
jgi:uncharacterized protein (UPF0264 family)